MINYPISASHRYKLVSKDGATFTMMLAGESGLGKTTFINTLFQTSLKNHQELRNRFNKPIKKTVEIDIIKAELEEKNFKLNLNIIDTPGFGDNVDNSNSWTSIVEFLDDQHLSYMKQEAQPHRDQIKDLRVHACLYFIRPTGHTLKPLDIETMKKLGTRVNLIPVISKADTLTPNEMLEFKKRIREIIEVHDIRIYSPPMELDDQAASEHAKQLIESMPFSIIGSEEEFDVNNTRVIGRKYPWGFVEVENDQHCDFRKLRSLLLRTNMLDLILSTNELHYEAFRTKMMNSNSSGIDDLKKSSDKLADKITNNPQFAEEEKKLKRYFAEQLRNEDQRFKQWKQNIYTEKNRLNHDLAQLQSQMKKLEEEVRLIQEKKVKSMV
jgi:cell division control protein 12